MNIDQFLAAKPQFANLAIVGKPDSVIEGKYCSVNCYKTSQESKCGNWHLSPKFIPVVQALSSDNDEEWIANSISYLPNMDFFINFTSFDQVRNWVDYKDKAVMIAFSFLEEEEQSFLKKELEQGEIDEFSYNYSLAEAKFYKSLWKLIKVDEIAIQKLLEKNWGYPFNASRDLFIEIVREDIEGEFCACLKRRYIYNASHINKIAKLKRKVHQGKASSTQINKLNSLIDQHIPFATWFNRLLIVAEHLSNKNSLIREYLENYREGIYALSKLQIQRDCDPNFKNHKRATHTWNQGQYHEGVLSWDS